MDGIKAAADGTQDNITVSDETLTDGESFAKKAKLESIGKDNDSEIKAKTTDGAIETVVDKDNDKSDMIHKEGEKEEKEASSEAVR